MTPPLASETIQKDKISSSSVSSVSTRPAGGFHQRKTSLTTACPPTGARINPSNTEKSSHTRLSLSSVSSHSTATQWLKRLFRLRIVRFLAWVYVTVSIVLSTVHLLTSFTNSHSASSVTIQDVAKLTPASLELSPLNDLTYRLRLSKMFSKSLIQTDHIRPEWFTASLAPAPDDVTLVTVLTMDEWPHLAHLAELYKGPISATLLIPAYTGGGLGSGTIVQHLSRLRRDYETQAMLSQHVDLHIIVRPNRQDAHGDTIHGGFQDGRNLARLFSRTNVIAYMPVTALWMTDLSAAASKYANYLSQGDVLIVPTLAYPRRKMEETWPTSKEEAKLWVEQGRMGLADFHWNLNEGPTAMEVWREATEPYQLPKYDYHYSPVYMITKEGHPWCEERFADEPAACLYSTYLAGADLWVLPDDFIVRTGQEPENQLTYEEKIMQVKLYKNFRIEQCVFYARQFEQTGNFDSERAKHVQEECEKELGELRKTKMVAAHH